VELLEDRSFLVTVVSTVGRLRPRVGHLNTDERGGRRARNKRALYTTPVAVPWRSTSWPALPVLSTVEFTAEIATRLRARIGGEFISPQAKRIVFQDIHLPTGANVYVYANDSDVTVLGVRDLLVEVVKKTRGELVGRCVRQRLLFQPTAWSFLRSGDAPGWLRQLHGIHAPVDQGLDYTPLPEPTARRRLLLFAMIVGNDFAKFKNVGSVTAARLAFVDGRKGCLGGIFATIRCGCGRPGLKTAGGVEGGGHACCAA
ncbi:unnamed protein product, partial [Ectocarpus sp. 12 AP-2014]